LYLKNGIDALYIDADILSVRGHRDFADMSGSRWQSAWNCFAGFRLCDS